MKKGEDFRVGVHCDIYAQTKQGLDLNQEGETLTDFSESRPWK